MNASAIQLEAVMESLYVLNKHAKQYAEQATKAYNATKKATASKNSSRKEALYSVKSEVLEELQSHTERVELHQIDGNDFYCLYFNAGEGWSFHTPVTEMDLYPGIGVSGEDRLLGFEKSSAKERSNQSLKESLLHLEEVFGINANEHLPEKYVSYGYDSYFIGWKYLGDD